MPLVDHKDIFDDLKVDMAPYLIKGNETNSVLGASIRKLARHINRLHREEKEEAVADAVKGMVVAKEDVIEDEYTDEFAKAMFIKNLKAKAVSGDFDAAFERISP